MAYLILRLTLGVRVSARQCCEYCSCDFVDSDLLLGVLFNFSYLGQYVPRSWPNIIDFELGSEEVAC